MKLGIIAPVLTLSKYCTTEVQYCLPRLIVECKPYRDFYRKEVSKGSLVILDTVKLTWKREPEDLQIIDKALELIRVDIVITPSYMYDTKRTLKVASEFLDIAKSKKIKELAGCVEGTTKDEIIGFSSKLKKLGFVTLAVPAHIHRIEPHLNSGPIIYIDNHLKLEELEGLEGILVTSLPVRLGLQGRLLSDYLPSPPSLNFYEEDKFENVIERNIKEALDFYE